MAAELRQAPGVIRAANLPFGSWSRGSASRRSDVDLLVMGLNEMRLLDAYDAVLDALADCQLPVQPLVARQALLVKHGDALSGVR